jgi:Flp pilus assembly pilin Flp
MGCLRHFVEEEEGLENVEWALAAVLIAVTAAGTWLSISNSVVSLLVRVLALLNL